MVVVDFFGYENVFVIWDVAVVGAFFVVIVDYYCVWLVLVGHIDICGYIGIV